MISRSIPPIPALSMQQPIRGLSEYRRWRYLGTTEWSRTDHGRSPRYHCRPATNFTLAFPSDGNRARTMSTSQWRRNPVLHVRGSAGYPAFTRGWQYWEYGEYRLRFRGDSLARPASRLSPSTPRIPSLLIPPRTVHSTPHTRGRGISLPQ